MTGTVHGSTTSHTDPPPGASAGGSVPDSFAASAAMLREACAAGDADAVAEALTRLRLACGEDPARWQEWSKVLTDLFDEGLAEAGVTEALGPEDVLGELRAGVGGVALRLLNHWHRKGTTAPLIAVGKALTTGKPDARTGHAASAEVALQLASWMAISQPGGANLLVEAAKAWLPEPSDPARLAAVENRMKSGRLFWHLPRNWQPFWEEFLDGLDAAVTPDWDAPEVRRAMSDLMRVTPGDWPGWAFLQSVLPPARWAELLQTYQSRPVNRRQWASPAAKAWVAPQGDMASGREGSLPAGWRPRGHSRASDGRRDMGNRRHQE